MSRSNKVSKIVDSIPFSLVGAIFDFIGSIWLFFVYTPSIPSQFLSIAEKSVMTANKNSFFGSGIGWFLIIIGFLLLILGELKKIKKGKYFLCILLVLLFFFVLIWRSSNQQSIALFYQNTTSTISRISTDIFDVKGQLLSGMTEFPEDAGLVDAMDLAVSSKAASGTQEGYNFLVDGLPILTVSGYSDGKGQILMDELNVGIGTSTPKYNLTVSGTVQFFGLQRQDSMDIKGAICMDSQQQLVVSLSGNCYGKK